MKLTMNTRRNEGNMAILTSWSDSDNAFDKVDSQSEIGRLLVIYDAIVHWLCINQIGGQFRRWRPNLRLSRK